MGKVGPRMQARKAGEAQRRKERKETGQSQQQGAIHEREKGKVEPKVQPSEPGFIGWEKQGY